MGVKGWRGIIRILQSLVGDQVYFIVTQEKSSDPPCPPPPTRHKFQDNINHFLRLQQPFIFKTLSFQNNWLEILIWPIRYSPKTDGGNPKLLLILAKLERLQTPHRYTQGDSKGKQTIFRLF